MDRELERRQRRLQFEIQGADSLERARIRDQQELDELASQRANSIRNWVDSQAAGHLSSSTPGNAAAAATAAAAAHSTNPFLPGYVGSRVNSPSAPQGNTLFPLRPAAA